MRLKGALSTSSARARTTSVQPRHRGRLVARIKRSVGDAELDHVVTHGMRPFEGQGIDDRLIVATWVEPTGRPLDRQMRADGVAQEGYHRGRDVPARGGLL